MQSTRKVAQITARPEHVRTIKIQPRFRQNWYNIVHVPEIRLSGFWLNKLGFAEGRRVTITTMKDQLIVQLQPE